MMNMQQPEQSPAAKVTDQSTDTRTPVIEKAPAPVTTEAMWSVLTNVIDPELHMNIVDLGLVYEVELAGRTAEVKMTLTTPGCPYGPYLLHEVDAQLIGLDGIDKVDLEVVWDPPWGPDKMSEEVRLELGFDV